MTNGELTGLFLIGLGGSGLLFIVVHKLIFLIPVFIAQHGRLSLIGLVSLFLLVIGSVILSASSE